MRAQRKDELQSCARDESSQYDWMPHVIPKSSARSDDYGSVNRTPQSERTTRASSCVLNFDVRRMIWVSCEVSKMSWWKRIIAKSSSRGASIRAKRSSTYSPIPLNCNLARTGRRVRVDRGRRRLFRSGKRRGDLNPMWRLSSLVNTERQVIYFVSGEKYPEWGVPQSSRRTRWEADRSRFGTPGNGI